MAINITWLQHVKWNGVSYTPGQVTTVADADAASLVAAHYAKLNSEPLPPPAYPDPLPQYVLDSDLTDPTKQAHRDLLGLVHFGLAVEGQGLIGYGASYEAGDLENTNANTRYINRLARRLGITVTNRSVGGQELADAIWNMHGATSTRRLVPGTKGLVLVSGIENDILRGGGHPDRIVGFREGIKTAIYRSWINAQFPYNDASIVYANSTDGTAWGNQGPANMAGDVAVTFKSNYKIGAKATFNIPAGVRDAVIWSYALEPGQWGIPSTFDLYVDGVLRRAAVQPPVMQQSLSAPGVTNALPWSIPIINLGAGAHTVEMRHLGTGNPLTGMFVDSWGSIDRDSLPQVVIPKVGLLDPARFPAGTDNVIVESFRDAVDDAVAEVIAECGAWAAEAITVVDPMAYGWDAAKMVGVDKVHPNDYGEAVLAFACVSELAYLPFRIGMTKGE